MSNITGISNYDHLENSNVIKRNAQDRSNQKQQKDNGIKDVLDENLKNTIKKENTIASQITIENAEQASSVLADVLLKIEKDPDAPKLASKLDSQRVNALINP